MHSIESRNPFLYRQHVLGHMMIPFGTEERKKPEGRLPDGWNLDKSEVSTDDIIAQFPIAFKDLED